MTRVYDEQGVAVATTLIEAGPCWITQLDTNDRAGWEAVQIGYEETKPKRLTKGQLGHLKNLPPLRHLREVPASSKSDMKVGDRVDASMFAEGDRIDVTGTSKGRGFAGVVKRHNFRGGPKTHGQSDRHRAPGSIGASSFPSRVVKGMRAAGRMGGDRVTTRNLKVVGVDLDNHLLVLRGAVPGAPGGVVVVRRAVARKPDPKPQVEKKKGKK